MADEKVRMTLHVSSRQRKEKKIRSADSALGTVEL
jgi:hypothetical protein